MTDSAASRWTRPLPRLGGTIGLGRAPDETALSPWSLAAGAILGVGLVVAFGSGISILERVVAVLAIVLAVLDPIAGLAFVAVTLPQREAQPIGPIGVPVLLAFGIGLGVILRLPLDRPRLRMGRVGWLGLAYLAVTAVSVTPFLNDLPYGQAVSAIGLFLSLAAGGVLIATGTILLRDRDARPLIALTLGSLAVASIVAVLAFVKGTDLGRPLTGLMSQGSTDLRAYGPFYNSDYLGFAAAQAIVLALGWAIYERRFRWPAVVIALIAGVALVASFARSGFLALAVGIVALAFMRNRWLGLVVLVFGGIVFGLVYQTLLQARVGITYGPAAGNALSVLSQSDAGRSSAVVAGVQIFLTSPVFGVGFGQFHYVSPRFVGLGGVTFPHDIFLAVLAEQGILGVLVFGALVVAIILGVRRSGHPLAIPVGALGITYLLGSFFIDSDTTLQTSILFWLCLAVVLSRPRTDRLLDPVPSARANGSTSG